MTKKRLRVAVTREDIQNGKPEAADSCPLYLAIDRAGRESDSSFVLAYVDGLYAVVEDDDDRQRMIELPTKAVDFVEKFDRTGKGKPFVFSLTLEDD